MVAGTNSSFVTVYWLKGNSSYYFEQYKISPSISKQKLQEFLFTEAPVPSLLLLPMPCTDLTLQYQAVKPCVHLTTRPLETGWN